MTFRSPDNQGSKQAEKAPEREETPAPLKEPRSTPASPEDRAVPVGKENSEGASPLGRPRPVACAVPPTGALPTAPARGADRGPT